MVHRADFAATITWGDGSTSTGIVAAGANGVFDVSGTHTFPNLTRHFGGLHGPKPRIS
jgi:hypothetical protein